MSTPICMRRNVFWFCRLIRPAGNAFCSSRRHFIRSTHNWLDSKAGFRSSAKPPGENSTRASKHSTESAESFSGSTNASSGSGKNSSKAKPTTCPGCGAALQTHSPDQPGFLPPSAQRRSAEAPKPSEVRRIAASESPLSPQQLRILLAAAASGSARSKPPVCMRCHRLRHGGLPALAALPAPARPHVAQLAALKLRSGGLVVLVADAFDLHGSIPRNIVSLVGPKKCIVALNKIDLMPHGHSIKSTTAWLRSNFETAAHAVDVVPVSARLGTGIDVLLSTINRHRSPNEDIFMLGVTNSGKSSIINRMVESCGHSGFVTTSSLAGTTIAPIAIPLSTLGPPLLQKPIQNPQEESETTAKKTDSGRLVDTAGIFNHTQLTHLVRRVQQRLYTPRSRIRPRSIAIRPETVICISSLVRIRVLEVRKLSRLGIFAAASLLVKSRPASQILSPPTPESTLSESTQKSKTKRGRKQKKLPVSSTFPPFSPAIRIDGLDSDKPLRVDLSGLGWIIFQGDLTAVIETPGGIGVHVYNTE